MSIDQIDQMGQTNQTGQSESTADTLEEIATSVSEFVLREEPGSRIEIWTDPITPIISSNKDQVSQLYSKLIFLQNRIVRHQQMYDNEVKILGQEDEQYTEMIRQIGEDIDILQKIEQNSFHNLQNLENFGSLGSFDSKTGNRVASRKNEISSFQGGYIADIAEQKVRTTDHQSQIGTKLKESEKDLAIAEICSVMCEASMSVLSRDGDIISRF